MKIKLITLTLFSVATEKIKIFVIKMQSAVTMRSFGASQCFIIFFQGCLIEYQLFKENKTNKKRL